MLQRVWDQLQEAGIAGNAVITAGGEQVELIKSQVQDAKIAVEPGRRDTFAAVLVSCAWLHSCGGASAEDYAAIMPVDPYTCLLYTSRMTTQEQINTTFKNVAGLQEEKEELREIVDFLKLPQKYTQV